MRTTGRCVSWLVLRGGLFERAAGHGKAHQRFGAVVLVMGAGSRLNKAASSESKRCNVVSTRCSCAVGAGAKGTRDAAFGCAKSLLKLGAGGCCAHPLAAMLSASASARQGIGCDRVST